MVARIERASAEAKTYLRDAQVAQYLAQHAREDFGRLRREYRERWNDRLPQWAVDIRFKGLAVAQECMTDDGWYSRQAQELSATANASYQEVVRLMGLLETFLRERKERALAEARAPRQREAS